MASSLTSSMPEEGWHILAAGLLTGVSFGIINNVNHPKIAKALFREKDTTEWTSVFLVELIIGIIFTTACIVGQALCLFHYKDVVLTRIGVAAIVFVLGHVVGPWGPVVNPSVALAQSIYGVQSIFMTVIIVLTQTLAGVLSLWLVQAMLPFEQTGYFSIVAQELAFEFPLLTEFWRELVLSFINYFACTGFPFLVLHLSLPKFLASQTASLAIVSATIVAGGGMNPAMTVAFSYVTGMWGQRKHIHNTAAPFLGGLLAGTATLIILHYYHVALDSQEVLEHSRRPRTTRARKPRAKKKAPAKSPAKSPARGRARSRSASRKRTTTAKAASVKKTATTTRKRVASKSPARRRSRSRNPRSPRA